MRGDLRGEWRADVAGAGQAGTGRGLLSSAEGFVLLGLVLIGWALHWWLGAPGLICYVGVVLVAMGLAMAYGELSREDAER